VSALARTANNYTLGAGRTGGTVLGSSEIAFSSEGTAYDLIMRLRPQFLLAHGPSLGTDPDGGRPVVYVDGILTGGTDELRTIVASSVSEVRYLSPVAGSSRFGRYHPGGVIALKMRR
jgi:hypothetical protein